MSVCIKVPSENIYYMHWRKVVSLLNVTCFCVNDCFIIIFGTQVFFKFTSTITSFPGTQGETASLSFEKLEFPLLRTAGLDL